MDFLDSFKLHICAYLKCVYKVIILKFVEDCQLMKQLQQDISIMVEQKQSGHAQTRRYHLQKL